MRKQVFRLKILNNKKGFTLVECIVAIALLAIVGTLGFSMFTNSARYMSKSKKEEAKQSQAQTAAQLETYKVENSGKTYYRIYSADCLQTVNLVLDLDEIDEDDNTYDGTPTKEYYIKIAYATEYGSVEVSTSITLAPTARGEQPGATATRPYRRFKVTGDKGSSARYVFIYTKYTYADEDVISDNNFLTENLYETK